MTVPRHRISAETFAALARFGGGAEAAGRVVAARLSKTTLLIQDVVRTSARVGHEQAAIARDGYAALIEVQRHAPDAVRFVLEYSFVGAWALRCAMLLRQGHAEAEPAVLARVAAAAAIRGAVPLTIHIGRTESELYLPSLGTADVHGAVTVVSCSDGAEMLAGSKSIALPVDGDAPGWHGVRRIRSADHRLDVLLDGRLPRSLPPDLTTRRTLSDSEVDSWRERLLAGWHLLADETPATADEVATVLRVVAPLRRSPVTTVSATLSDAFGCVVMSLPGNDVHTAVTLTHEVQHAKLTALTDLVSLVDIDAPARFYAPWREDPRPGLGLTHGLYAHMAIAGFWRRHRQVADTTGRFEADVEYARWVSACREVADVLLGSDLLTPAGRRFVEAIAAQLAEWSTDPILPAARELAHHQAATHRSQWAHI
jgi:uncharacterized protein